MSIISQYIHYIFIWRFKFPAEMTVLILALASARPLSLIHFQSNIPHGLSEQRLICIFGTHSIKPKPSLSINKRHMRFPKARWFGKGRRFGGGPAMESLLRPRPPWWPGPLQDGWSSRRSNTGKETRKMKRREN